MNVTPDNILDVAIVGAGVSGVYSAWRMLRDGRGHTFKGATPRIAVFEGSGRIGGRLLSLTPPKMPNTRCELGGMRYMSRHLLVSWLVQTFGLKTEPMGVTEPDNVAYLRGRQVRLCDLNTPALLPYNFTSIEQRVVADPKNSLLLYALLQIVPNATAITYEQLLEEMQTAEFDGQPLHDQGFWNVMARVLSPDGYWFVRDTNGYDCLVSNWSAADAIPFILADFGQGVTYSRFPNGYEELPQRLADGFRSEGGTIRFDMSLRSFDTAPLPDDTTGVEMHFSDGSTVYARKLVLAMPRRSLELIEPTGAILDPKHKEVRELIESVMPIPLFKIFLCYEYPWWKSIGVNTGRSLTDMPIRQCYYWGVEPKTPLMDGRSCLLASYDDDLSVTFWAGLRQKTAATKMFGANQNLSAECAGSSDWADYSAPEAMVHEAHRQVVAMHGVSYAPLPYAAAYRDWVEDPYGGGVNFWQIHARSWEVIPAIVNPRPGIPVYVCGEAYSHEQGWVEGALQTAEIMLQRHFELAPPPPMQPPPAAARGAA